MTRSSSSRNGTRCASRPVRGEATRPGRRASRSSSSAGPISARLRAMTSMASATGGLTDPRVVRGVAVREFSLTYEGFDPEAEGLREVLTSTGNGRFCARGAAEWEDADGVHYPGTYAHGIYNRETTILGGVPVRNEDLVNLPNWLVLKLRIEGGDAVRLTEVETLDYRQELDLRRVVMTRSVRFRDPAGRETTLYSRRFVS